LIAGANVQNPESPAKILLRLLIQGYFLIGFLTVPYFNYQYATKHGFWSWLFFGEVMATLKSFAWPLWLFGS
jgi:hypothetical protein